MKNKRLLLISLTCFAIAAGFLTLLGCTNLPIEPFSGHVCFNLYVVPSPAEMPSVCRENGWEACYVGKSNSIYMPGKRSVGDYIYIQDNILGHEVKHVLNRDFKERFENPDNPEKFFTNF